MESSRQRKALNSVEEARHIKEKVKDSVSDVQGVVGVGLSSCHPKSGEIELEKDFVYCVKVNVHSEEAADAVHAKLRSKQIKGIYIVVEDTGAITPRTQGIDDSDLAATRDSQKLEAVLSQKCKLSISNATKASKKLDLRFHSALGKSEAGEDEFDFSFESVSGLTTSQVETLKRIEGISIDMLSDRIGSGTGQLCSAAILGTSELVKTIETKSVKAPRK